LILAMSMKVFAALYAEPLWAKRAQACRNVTDLARVVDEFAQEKGFKIKDLDTPEIAA